MLNGINVLYSSFLSLMYHFTKYLMCLLNINQINMFIITKNSTNIYWTRWSHHTGAAQPAPLLFSKVTIVTIDGYITSNFFFLLQDNYFSNYLLNSYSARSPEVYSEGQGPLNTQFKKDKTRHDSEHRDWNVFYFMAVARGATFLALMVIWKIKPYFFIFHFNKLYFKQQVTEH